MASFEMDVDDIDVVMTVAALLLLTAIGASRLSSRLGVPALVLFLGTVLAVADQLTLIAGEDSLRDVQRMLLGNGPPDG